MLTDDRSVVLAVLIWKEDWAVQCLRKSADEEGTSGDDRDAKPAIPVNEIPLDLVIRDLGVVEIPLVNC